MPPRPTRRPRVPRYPVRSNVHNITNLAQWTRLHNRSKNKLIFVLYTQDDWNNNHRLKQTLVELSSHAEFQDVLFAVVDIERAQEVAEQENVVAQNIPTFICYHSGAVVDKAERVGRDAAQSQLWQMLHRNAVRVRAETARNVPNATSSIPWRAVGQAVAFLALAIGSVLAVALMKPMPAPEVEEREVKERVSREHREGSRALRR